MAEQNGEKTLEFDVKVFCDSFRKAIEVREIVKAKNKIDLTPEIVKDVAITLFRNSMANISERLKEKAKSQQKESFY